MDHLSRIKRLSKIQGINQRQLGQALGLQQGTMSRKLSGQYGMDVNELQTIANFLGTSASYLLTGELGHTPTHESILCPQSSPLNSPLLHCVPLLHRNHVESYLYDRTAPTLGKVVLPGDLLAQHHFAVWVDNGHLTQTISQGSHAIVSTIAPAHQPRPIPVIASVMGQGANFYYFTACHDHWILSQDRRESLRCLPHQALIYGYLIQAIWRYHDHETHSP